MTSTVYLLKVVISNIFCNTDNSYCRLNVVATDIENTYVSALW